MLAVGALKLRIFYISGESMLPTLEDGCTVVCLKTNDVQYGDVVIGYLDSSSGDSVCVVKRLVGLPGDRIEIRNGHLERNGVRLDEGEYLYDFYMTDSGEWVVGDDSIFVLGDNRNDSYDSRQAGQMKREDVIGKVVMHSR